MRDIEFRGKRVDNGEWCYGDLLRNTSLVFVSETFKFCEVQPETVGQYTGLEDKNGTKIYEGDIVRGKDYGGLRRDGSVEFNEIGAKYIIIPNTKSQYRESNTIKDLCPAEDYLEVIGNIHDNKELLTVAD